MACLVGYVWVSELCASSLDRQLGAFNMSIPLINKSSDEVNLSTTFIQERLTCILLTLALCVQPDFTEFKSTIFVFHHLVRYIWMCSVSVCCWHVITKFVYLANEKVIKGSLQYSLAFVINEPSDSKNEGAELAFIPKNVI